MTYNTETGLEQSCQPRYQKTEKAKRLAKLLLEAQEIAIEFRETDELNLQVNKVNLELAIMRCQQVAQNYQIALEDFPS